VVNQWGRDGNFSSSSARSSGAGGVVVAALVALLLGAGGGYTAARMFSGASASDLEARDNRIAALEKQVSDLKFTTSGNANQENVLRARLEELTRANESLKEQIDESDGKAGADAEAEIAALKKTIEEAGDSRLELSRARRSLQVAELQIIELESEIASQRGELNTLRKNLTDVANQGDAGSKALSEQIKSLEAALADSRRQASAVTDLRKKLASVNADLAKRTNDLGATRTAMKFLETETDKVRAELSRTTAEAAKAKKDLAAALAASKDKGGESEALQKELAAAEEQLAARDGDIGKLNARLAQARRDLDEARAKAGTADAQRIAIGLSLGAMRTEKEKLEGDVAVLRQTIESLKAAQREDKPQPDVTDSGEDVPAVARRDADDVRDALEDMPGFGRLTPDKQIELAQRLEDGECAADALKTTLGRVPAIALRNLIRDLGSKC
jgi:chromosome segregation ATPase